MTVFRIVVTLVAAIVVTSSQCDAFSPLHQLPTRGKTGTGLRSSSFSTSSTTFVSSHVHTNIRFRRCHCRLRCWQPRGCPARTQTIALDFAVISGGDVGGTCVNRGCAPSKALLAASGLVWEMKAESHLKDLGI
jgi:hypothetical protein